MKSQRNSYTVVITKYALKKLGKLPTDIQSELSKRILDLEINPRPSGCKKLTNRPGYRIRYSDYRIITQSKTTF